MTWRVLYPKFDIFDKLSYSLNMSEFNISYVRAGSNLTNFLASDSIDAEFAKSVVAGRNLAQNTDITRNLVEFGQVGENGYTIDAAKCLGVGLVGYSRGGSFVCYPIHVSSEGFSRETIATEALLDESINRFMQTPELDQNSVRSFIGGGRMNFMTNKDYLHGLKFVQDTLKKGGITSDSRVFDPNTSRSVGNLFMGQGRVLWVASDVK